MIGMEICLSTDELCKLKDILKAYERLKEETKNEPEMQTSETS